MSTAETNGRKVAASAERADGGYDEAANIGSPVRAATMKIFVKSVYFVAIFSRK